MLADCSIAAVGQGPESWLKYPHFVAACECRYFQVGSQQQVAAVSAEWLNGAESLSSHDQLVAARTETLASLRASGQDITIVTEMLPSHPGLLEQISAALDAVLQPASKPADGVRHRLDWAESGLSRWSGASSPSESVADLSECVPPTQRIRRRQDRASCVVAIHCGVGSLVRLPKPSASAEQSLKLM